MLPWRSSKSYNADYSGVEAEKALSDFKKRVTEYEKVYESVEDAEFGAKIRYIKIYNVGSKVTAKGCEGYLASQVVFFLQVHKSYYLNTLYSQAGGRE